MVPGGAIAVVGALEGISAFACTTAGFASCPAAARAGFHEKKKRTMQVRAARKTSAALKGRIRFDMRRFLSKLLETIRILAWEWTALSARERVLCSVLW